MNFCPNCGQENNNLNVSFTTLLLDFLGDFFTFDSKLFRSIFPLLIKPGNLTNRFIEGKRVRYIPPLRMYIFISFIYFFLISLDHKETSEAGANLVHPDTTEIDDDFVLNIGKDTIKGDEFKTLLDKGSEEEINQALDTMKFEGDFEKFIAKRALKMYRQKERVPNYILKNVSTMMFFLLPVFALLLMIFYRKSKMYYIEHLVFSLHLHTFFFLFNAIYLLFPLIGLEIYSLGLAVLVTVVYFFIALFKVYKQSFGKTLLKEVLLLATYGIVGLVMFVITITISVLLF